MGGHHLRGPLARYAFQAYDDWTVIAGSLRLAAATGKPAELIARMLLDDKHRSRITDMLVHLHGAGGRCNPADHCARRLQKVITSAAQKTSGATAERSADSFAAWLALSAWTGKSSSGAC